MPWSNSVGVFYLLVAAIAMVLTGLAFFYARRANLMDAPGERRSHSEVTARGGGIAMVVTIALGAAWAFPIGRLQLSYFGFLAGFLLVALIGWIDDHRPLSVKLRLSVHALAAALFAFSLVWELGAQTYTVILGVMAFALCMVLTNVWNFMDGINGLAAATAIVVFAVLGLYANAVWMVIALLASAACFGFLPWNFPKARIFMGDVGSGALGFAIGACLMMSSLWLMTAPGTATVVFSWGRYVDGLALLLILPSLFLVDSGMTLMRRVLNGEQWWTAHVQHTYQVWARRSGHSRVTLMYVLTTIAGAILCFILSRNPTFIAFCSACVWYMCVVMVWLFIQSRRWQ